MKDGENTQKNHCKRPLQIVLEKSPLIKAWLNHPFDATPLKKEKLQQLSQPSFQEFHTKKHTMSGPAFAKSTKNL